MSHIAHIVISAFFVFSSIFALIVSVIYFHQWQRNRLTGYAQRIVLGIAITGLGISGFHMTHTLLEHDTFEGSLTYISILFLCVSMVGYFLHISPFLGDFFKDAASDEEDSASINKNFEDHS